MIRITLPDNSIKNFDGPISGIELVDSIGPSLAKAALAMRVDDKLVDLVTPITSDAKVTIITGKDPEGLEIIRHDAAHILAEAVQELFPETQVTIGPAIENGFYYDFARDEPFTTDDLELIEQRMYEIVKRDEAITRHLWTKEEAIKYYKEKGEHYKVEIIEAIPAEDELSFYKQGNFVDLCRGPHAPSTAKIKAFKLTKLAGAYWRGDSKNKMLQRIYGTAWASKEDLKQYLMFLEEAAKRDHRKLGKELDLFHLQEEAPGMIFWHEKGWTLYRIIENYIRNKIAKEGYIEVKTPMLVDRALWEASGHWEKFGHAMFTSVTEDKTMALKPMSCPCHVQIFNQGLKSYRDLPLKMAEFGACHRNEPSGSLHGIMRVRGFVQDDAHIFCSEDMITDETIKFCKLLKEVYNDFGFTDVKVKFSDRPEVRAGSDETWDKAENSLKEAVEAAGLEYSMNPGEGAFYGPKLEFVLRDAIGRDWQCGTLQVDFVLPERLDAAYIGADGNKHRPVMLHRAIIGTFERFIGILIEQYGGKFPVWLAPVQVAIVNVTSDAEEYAIEIKKRLDELGIRSKLDISAEKINYKIRQHSIKKIPLIFAVGKKEMENNTVSIRRIGSEQQEITSLQETLNNLIKEAAIFN
ncbi:MAG: threonine--tRNA ligase [Alphaproteobacteria bacterium]